MGKMRGKMRTNTSITSTETKVRDDDYLMSRTDLKGCISYASPDFLRVSQFKESELLGKSHNIIRHADMPSLVYKDFWETIQAGRAWMGVIKNRRKDGGFYWVMSYVSPIYEEGKPVGYASVQVKPTDRQVKRAEEDYAKINRQERTDFAYVGGLRTAVGVKAFGRRLLRPFSGSLQWRSIRVIALLYIALALLTWLNLGLPSQLEPYKTSLLVAALIIGVLPLIPGVALVAQIRQALRQTGAVLRQIIIGNLEVAMPPQSGITAGIVAHLRLMQTCLVNIISKINLGAKAMLEAVSKLTEHNQALQVRISEQASSLQETAAAMEQLTATVQQTTQNSFQADKLAQQAVNDAQLGSKAAQTAQTTMQQVAQQSEKITQIINLIEEIAFQTNILALNAAVEAARAGQAGQGFAVVASEVRALAWRSSDAAREIGDIIGQSASQILLGNNQVQETAEAINNISESITRVSEVIREISQASSEQATGLSQIHTAINELDKITKSNEQMATHFNGTILELEQRAKDMQAAAQVLAQ